MRLVEDPDVLFDSPTIVIRYLSQEASNKRVICPKFEWITVTTVSNCKWMMNVKIKSFSLPFFLEEKQTDMQRTDICNRFSSLTILVLSMAIEWEEQRQMNVPCRNWLENWSDCFFLSELTVRSITCFFYEFLNRLQMKEISFSFLIRFFCNFDECKWHSVIFICSST